MTTTIIGLCTLKLYLPGVHSLKEKRGILKSMLARMHNTFNVSAAEVDHQDVWQTAGIAFVLVGTSGTHVNQVIRNILDWMETHFPDAVISQQEIEIL
jgi:uncharacterized protein